MEDALTQKGDEGRCVSAISFGEVTSNLWSGDLRMGKPRCVNHNDSSAERRDGSKPGEVKHLSTQRKINCKDSLSSGERTGNSLNFFLEAILDWRVIGIVHLNFEPREIPSFAEFKLHKELQIRTLAEWPWNGQPKRVIVPYAKAFELLYCFLSSPG